MPVPPEAVWDVLADPGEYGYWVVGSKVIRDADPHWPEPGSKFHHTVGFGPFKVSDHTVSLEADAPRRLRTRAKGRPFGTATVTLEMTPRDGGTVVSITENPDGIYRPLALLPPVQIFSLGRNAESLMRLEELALRKAARRGDRSGAPRGRAQAPSSA
jgi:Polyketide cyclase / dehydrase and lipid transport